MNTPAIFAPLGQSIGGQMKTIPFTEMRSKQLVLRRLKESDWEVVSYLRSDSGVNRFIKRPSAENKGKALEFIAKTNQGIDNQGQYYWVITKHGEDQMIGSICLWNFSDDKKAAEVGYDLHPDFHGIGIMTESLIAVLAFGFDTLKLELIDAYTHEENSSSRKLLERNGFRLAKDKKDPNNKDNVIYERARS